MRLTNRDRRLIMKIAAGRWLTTAQIAALCFRGVSLEMTRRRLRLLRMARYLRSSRAHEMAEAIHTLGPRGLEVASPQGRLVAPRGERALPRNLEHLIGVNDIRVAVERSADIQGTTVAFFFAAWELQAHGWNLPVIPDAVCRVQQGARSATAAFEYDRGEERPSYLVRSKFPRYRQGFHGFPFSRVVFVAETSALRNRLEAYAAAHCPDPRFSFIARPTLSTSWSVVDLLA